MLDAQLGALVTIAGTGGVGFAGDGGLGRLALLRHPEGLALKPNMASGQEAPRAYSRRMVPGLFAELPQHRFCWGEF